MPTSIFQHARTRVLLLAAVMLGALAAFTAAAPPALAHDELVSSTPADGAVLEAAPAEIELIFSSELMDLGNQVIVADAAGTNVVASEPVLNRETLVQALPALENGDYQVSWRAVSGDGHPITGTFSFTVGAPAATESAPAPATEAATPEAAPTPAPEETIAPGTTSESTSFGPWSWVFTILGGGLAGALIYVIIVFVKKRRRGESA